MKSRVKILRLLSGLVLGLAVLAPLAAQNRLYVLEPDANYHVVLKVSRGRPQIMVNGKLVAASGQRFALRKVEEYLPVVVTVHDLQAATTAMQTADVDVVASGGLTHEFHFSAKFESACALDDVFVVLELDSANVGKSIFVYDVGQLEPQRPRTFSVNLPLDRILGPGQCKLHLFTGGTEVFNSEQPAAYREETIDRMIAKRIAGVRQAGPKPFMGTAPEYPATLRQAGLRGEAVVTMLISPQGRVQEATVASATEPPFGEAALAAVRQWRFLPQVEDGRAVEVRVSMPFAFTPPPAGAAGKN